VRVSLYDKTGEIPILQSENKKIQNIIKKNNKKE